MEEEQKGDLIIKDPIKRYFPFCVECKDVEGIYELEKLLSKRPASFISYLDQAKDQARYMGLIPLLVWKRGKNASIILCAFHDCHSCDRGVYIFDFKLFLKEWVSLVKEHPYLMKPRKFDSWDILNRISYMVFYTDD